MVGGCILEDNAAASATFDSTRRAARTNEDGLPAGQRFDRTADRKETDCNGARKDGPPIAYVSQFARSRCVIGWV